MKRTDFEPTPDERRNGWTKAALAQYFKERDKEAEAFVLIEAKTNKALVEVVSTRAFNPIEW